jgi:NAD(P)H-hydrate epimerase
MTTTLQMISTVPRLSERPRDAHKGTFGRVLVVAGSVGMSGAAALAGHAALRGGAGLVQVAVPAPIASIVAAHQPCYMVSAQPDDVEGKLSSAALPGLLKLAEGATAVVVGPGLGQTEEVRITVRGLCAKVEGPLLLDADALNVLGEWPGAWKGRKGPTVITPHPGEFARLNGSNTAAVQADRHSRAAEFAQTEGGVVLLKGAGTVVTDGRRAYVNTTGNPGMATGGSGDVLSGLIGALLAQGMSAFDAAVLGAYLHGMAGDMVAQRVGETSLIATDLIEELPNAFRAGIGSEKVAQ